MSMFPRPLLEAWLKDGHAQLLDRGRVKLSPHIVTTLTGNPLYEDADYHEDDDDWVFPTHIDTPAVLEFLGFSPRRAKEIFEFWTEYSPNLVKNGGADDILAMAAIACCRGETFLGDDDAEWRQRLLALGFSEKFVEWQMDSLLKEVRGILPLEEWLQGIIDTRYAALERLRGLCTQADIKGFTPLGAASEKSLGIKREPKDHIQWEGVSLDEDNRTPEEAAPPGFKYLYKVCRYDTAIDLPSRVQGMYTLLKGLLSKGPHDFSPGSALYLTPQKWFALRQARIDARSSRIASIAPPVILRITVPHSFYTGLTVLGLPVDDTWKCLVWECKRARVGHGLPRLSRGMYGDNLLLIGHVCGKHTKAVTSLEHWRDVDESWVVKSESGENACQYAFGAGLEKALVGSIPLSGVKVVHVSEWSQWSETD